MCVCVYHLFICSSVDGYKLFPCLGYCEYYCYEQGGKDIFLSLFSFPSDIFPQMELLDSMFCFYFFEETP